MNDAEILDFLIDGIETNESNFSVLSIGTQSWVESDDISWKHIKFPNNSLLSVMGVLSAIMDDLNKYDIVMFIPSNTCSFTPNNDAAKTTHKTSLRLSKKYSQMGESFYEVDYRYITLTD